MFKITPKPLGHFDVAVIGGGVAGVASAVSSAKEGARIALIEADGCLGGIMTKCIMPYMMDNQNKGGIVRQFYSFLDEKDMTCPRHGRRRDENGKNINGALFDTEGAKYFFDKICCDAGVKIFYHSRVSAVNLECKKITEVLLSTECGFYSLSADVFIDATGNGNLADLAGCSWECGEPKTYRISPASMEMLITGFRDDYLGTDSEEDKKSYGKMLNAHGIYPSSEQASVVKLPQTSLWNMSINFEYGVSPDDIDALTKATVRGQTGEF